MELLLTGRNNFLNTVNMTCHILFSCRGNQFEEVKMENIFLPIDVTEGIRSIVFHKSFMFN